MNDTTYKEEKKEETTQLSNQEAILNINLGDEDKLVKKIDHETLSLNGDAYKIIENYRDALDLEMLEQRYSDFLEKYDYIVGDIAYEKLRLRGFYYSKNKKVPIDMRITSLNDYLTEYCSFGCAYFVLERIEPKRKQRQSKRKPKSNQKQKNQQTKKQQNLKKFDQVKKQKQNEKKTDRKQGQTKKTFTKKDRQKEPVQNQKPNSAKQENKVKTVKNQKGETKFKIRQKNDPES